jgi:hypothetical protein
MQAIQKILIDRKFFLACLLVALVAVWSGCGSSGESGSLSQAEFIKQGDEICAKSNDELQAKFIAFQKEHQGRGVTLHHPEREEVGETIVRPSIQDRLAELEELGSPEGEGAAVKKIMDAYDTVIEKSAGHPFVVLEIRGSMEELQKVTADYGFKVCGQLYE